MLCITFGLRPIDNRTFWDLRCSPSSVTASTSPSNTSTEAILVPTFTEIPLFSNSFFTTSAYRLTEPMECDYSELDSFVILICTEGTCRVACGGESVTLTAGHTLLVAAEAEGVTLTPEGRATVLESYV